MKRTPELAASQKLYYEANKEKLLVKAKERRESNILEFKRKDQANYLKNKEQISEQRKNSRNTKLSSRLSALLGNSRARAKKNSWEFDLSIDFLVSLYKDQNGLCALTGVELSLKADRSRWVGNLISLDRIDPAKGYLKSNVQFVTTSVNYAKGSLTQQQFFDLCERVVRNA